MAYISEEYGFAFFAAPATGSSAVIKALQDAGIGEFWPPKDIVENDRRIAPSKHSTLADLRAAGIADRVDGLLKVVGVRNLFAWYVAKFLRNTTSRIHNVRNKDSWIYQLPASERDAYIARLSEHEGMDFPQFLESMTDRNREYIDSPYHADMDVYLHQENLEKEFRRLVRKLDIGIDVNVEPYNVTGAIDENQTYKDYYDSDMVDLVYDKNAAFFLRFPEYTFEGLNLKNGGVIAVPRSLRVKRARQKEKAKPTSPDAINPSTTTLGEASQKASAPATKIQAQTYDAASLKDRGRGRAKWFADRLGLDDGELRGARLLEVGCGFGEFSAAMEDMFGVEAVGIDPWPRFGKGPYADRNFHRPIDITDDQALSLGKFDYVASFDVLEHVETPKQALTNIFQLLKPGGRAFLKYNLHRGANASHIVHLTKTPWCHLIMSDEEIGALTEKLTGTRRTPAWVNKATYAHYLVWYQEIGFEMLKTWYVRYPMDPEFYVSHHEVLSRYPKDDLDKDFMCVTVKKPAARKAK